MRTDVVQSGAALPATAALTWLLTGALGVANATTVALSYLLLVLVIAALARLAAALVASVAAMLCFNFFFLPPVGTLTIADPQNWVALAAFLAVSLVASHLSSTARSRTQEAIARRDETARLFDLSRDVLLITDSREAISQFARTIVRRFDLLYVAIALPGGRTPPPDERAAPAWQVFEAGPLAIDLSRAWLSEAYAGMTGVLEFDATERTYAGHRTSRVGGHEVRLVPLRMGARPIGLLASAGRPVEPSTLDALAGVVALAVERIGFLEERKAAELSRQSEALKTALLASIGHDLRTPLTAIHVAAANLHGEALDEGERREQSEIILVEVERLTRLFQNILDMARIDAGAVASELLWTHPSEIIAASRDQVQHTLGQHPLEVIVDEDVPVRVDPRLTATALAHLLENAAQYTPSAASILVRASVNAEGLVIRVRDRGRGIAAADLPHLFDRFYRGEAARARASGSGMGLAIARGLLAAQRGRVWAENTPDGGAEFTIVVPAESRPAAHPRGAPGGDAPAGAP
jgi:two-component system sensor histidine kinase KdpD